MSKLLNRAYQIPSRDGIITCFVIDDHFQHRIHFEINQSSINFDILAFIREMKKKKEEEEEENKDKADPKINFKK